MDPSSLKYYIHDHVGVFRLQLLGSLRAQDLPELDGCWRTAQSSVAGRHVQLDIRLLSSVDGPGQDWLSEMAATNSLEFVVSPESARFAPPGGAAKTIDDAERRDAGKWAAQVTEFFATIARRQSHGTRLPDTRAIALELKAAKTEISAS